MNLVIVDYGVGNFASIKKHSKKIGVQPIISSDITLVSAADKLILQGVGAFEAYRKKHLKV